MSTSERATKAPNARMDADQPSMVQVSYKENDTKPSPPIGETMLSSAK